MKEDYIRLENGQKLRVESNWNSFETFCDLTGRNNLKALEEVGNIRLNEAPILMWACVREGEKLEGNKLKLSLDELKKKINPVIMGAFFKIYTRQTFERIPKEYQSHKEGSFTN